MGSEFGRLGFGCHGADLAPRSEGRVRLPFIGIEALRELYQELGFEEIPQYYFNPIEGKHELKVKP